MLREDIRGICHRPCIYNDEGGSWWEVNRVPDFYKNQFKKLEDDTKADMEGRNQNFNN